MLGPATRNIGPKYPQVPHGNTTWLKYWKGPVCSGKGLTGTVFSERSFLNMNGELVHSQNLENGTCVFNGNYQHLNKLIDWDGRISLRIFHILNIKKIVFLSLLEPIFLSDILQQLALKTMKILFL